MVSGVLVQMAETEKASPLLLCTSCGRPVEAGQHLCGHCGAPVTPFGFSDPILGIQARRFAAHSATKTQKRIVVIGMWLWIGPMLLVGVGLGVLGGAGVIAALKGDAWGWLGLPIAVLGGVFVWIGATLVVRTTGSFLRFVQGRETADSSLLDEDEEELMKCLRCGEEFEARKEACPRCGWSYADSET
jgi:ribosomal protein L37E